jgi:hypothetical protein
MRARWFLGLAVVAALGGRVGATEPGGRWWLGNWCARRPPCPCCPDDYCPKSLPTTAPVKCFGKDDYCPRPLPVTPPVKCFGKDDYCPRPCPITVPRCYPPWYTCGPSEPAGPARVKSNPR